MKTAVGDLWTYPADLYVVTTNGQINSKGRAIMGKGIALQAKNKFPGIDLRLGLMLQDCGNCVLLINSFPNVASFPTKHHWHSKSDLQLIRRSAKELRALADMIGSKSVVLPPPGCGNGGLHWEDVQPVIEPYLDDRFTVVMYGDTPIPIGS